MTESMQALSASPLKNLHGWEQNLVPGLVSIVMPTYNCENSLSASIRSVQAQTCRDWELVIVDDASSDASLEIARRFAIEDKRIRVLPLSQNGGAARARNAAINAARGQYLAFLDSDDLWLPQKLAVQVEFLKSHNAGFCFGSYCRWNGADQISAPVPVPQTVQYSNLLCGNVIPCLTVLLDRERIASFRMPQTPHEDYAAWLAILRQGHTAYGMQIDLARYRVSPQSLSANKFKCALWHWQILRAQEKLRLPRAIWCFLRYALRGILIRGTKTPRLASATG
ncbi:MAG TPA: glycosyltransferase family 2 protein [Terracidiphilus sp.]|nr:glycosyltransferase family 2 protein [Terracidiphilus sp.]